MSNFDMYVLAYIAGFQQGVDEMAMFAYGPESSQSIAKGKRLQEQAEAAARKHFEGQHNE